MVNWTVFRGLCCVDTSELHAKVKVGIHAVVIDFEVRSTMTFGLTKE